AAELWRRQRLRARVGDRRVPVHPRHSGAAPERAALQEGGLMATVEAEAAPVVVADPRERTTAKIGRFATKLPVHIFLLFVGVLWLMPTIGLFFTSLLSPADFDSVGWWKLFSQPHLATWANYSNVWHNTDIPSALRITAEIAIGGTILPIMIAALAPHAFAWIDFPGRDISFFVVVALLLAPIQIAPIPIFTPYNNTPLFAQI